MRTANRIVLASNNRDKLTEFQALIRSYPDLEIIPASELLRNSDKIAQVENHVTYLENAAAKARLVNWGCHHPALGDDSGLEVDALGGKPGPRSARFAVAKAGQSQAEANTQKLLEDLRGRPMDARGARFVCTLALVMEGVLIHATGVLEGTIAEAPQGTNGFGYDPVFIPKGSTKTLGQMSDDEKNAISHRAQAMKLLMDEVSRKGLSFAKP